MLDTSPSAEIIVLAVILANFSDSVMVRSVEIGSVIDMEQDFGITKIPSSEKIQKRIDNLVSEKASTIREKQELREKQKTLEIIRQNFTALLNATKMQISLSEKENIL